MRAVVHFVQDNAMFYKDITQWLRNRTFASLFFGLLLVAEAMSLFIIAGSDDITNPGSSMFYTLFLVLIVYAMLIGYLGNSLTSREFMNRTFELYELSGMSLERMVGGKIISMFYQFMFGFFCLVPFMFFSYFLGGLDFLEMIIGVLMICLFAVPLYLVSLLTALTGRFKQINLLTRLASVFVLGWIIFFAFASFFASEPFAQELVRWVTEQVKEVFAGSTSVMGGFFLFFLIYTQVCLLLFYFCCDSISRETDSREIPIKILLGTLIVSWLSIFALNFVNTGYTRNSIYIMTVPVFLALMALGVRTFYNRPGVPPIVARDYRDAGSVRRIFFWWFQPGLRGSLRTLFLLIGISVFGSMVALSFAAISPLHSSPVGFGDWWNGMSLLVQVPYFLAIPHVFFARRGELRYNYPGQRTLAVTTWVVVGALVLIYGAWTDARMFGYSSSDYNFSTALEVLMVTLLSPLPSLSAVGSDDALLRESGAFVRIVSGVLGAYLIISHVRHVMNEEETMKMEAEGSAGNNVTSYKVTAPEEDLEQDGETMPAAVDAATTDDNPAAQR